MRGKDLSIKRKKLKEMREKDAEKVNFLNLIKKKKNEE
jgi:hypothetical protein